MGVGIELHVPGHSLNSSIILAHNLQAYGRGRAEVGRDTKGFCISSALFPRPFPLLLPVFTHNSGSNVEAKGRHLGPSTGRRHATATIAMGPVVTTTGSSGCFNRTLGRHPFRGSGS